ncbi:MAG TPA: alpha/beta hydrolase [Euzebyales bacterium]
MPKLEAETVATFRPLVDLVPEGWRTATTTAADGTELHWTDTGGDGAPVVLLHGLQVDGLSWLRTAQALAPSHRVVMPDLRGHGRSGRVHTTASTGVHVDDVTTVLDAADVECPVVVGHSLGAEVAGFLAARGRMRGVVLVDPVLVPMPSPVIDVDAPPPWLAPIFATLRALPTQTHNQRMRAGLTLLPPGVDVDWHEVDYVTFVEGQSRFDLDVYRHLDPDGASLAASPDAVAAIDCPILLLTARPMLPGAGGEVDATPLTGHWRDGRHVHFPGSGHHIAADRFDRFVREVGAFIADVGDPDGATDGQDP